MAKRKTTSGGIEAGVLEHEQASATASTETGPSPANGAKKTRRTTRKTAAAQRIPEEVTVDFQEVKDRLQQASTWVQEAAGKAEQVRAEAAQTWERLQQRVRETEAEAAEALKNIRQARHEVEHGLRQHKGAEKEARQALDEVQKLQKRTASAEQHLAELEERLEEAQEHVQSVRQSFQGVGETLIQESRQQLDQARRQFEEARAQLETARRRYEERSQQQPEPAPPPVPAVVQTYPVPAVPSPAAPAADLDGQRVVAEVDRPVEEVARLERTAREGEEVIKATIRAEPPRLRLIRHLNQAWAAESAVSDELRGMSEQVIEPDLRKTLGEHRALTHRHQQALEGRLRALRAEPSGDGSNKGVLERMVSWVWGAGQREPDDYDRTVQELLRATAAEHFEVAMYRALAALATAVGDEETAAVARRNQREKQEAVAALDAYAPSLAGLAEQMIGVAQAADPEHVVIEAEVKEEGKPKAKKKK